MAYTPGYEYDVFVSYARKDDETGWITEIVRQLGSDVSSGSGAKVNFLRLLLSCGQPQGQ